MENWLRNITDTTATIYSYTDDARSSSRVVSYSLGLIASYNTVKYYTLNMNI
jgi:hypothetical protein